MSGSTTKKFEYIYVLQSGKDKKRYVGYTQDLRERLRKHTDGKVASTFYRLPLELIYFEACLSQTDARRRERYFKTTGGRRFLAKRLKDYYLINH